MIFFQIILYLLLFTGMVALVTRGGAVNALFFYPKPVQERAFAIGLADRTAIGKRRKRFMVLFCLVMLGALLFIIGVWNGVRDFKTAYWQALLFLEIMNWYDGIVIDKLWVGYSKFWVLPGTEDIPFIQTWKQVLKKRGFLTLIWIVGSAIVGGLIVLIF
ncbi:MAG: hypothetical protein Q4C77_18180 [Eubacteriales bacterium]|nr:hypothetical protein [Eubacteriales bacterium]